MRTIPVRNWKNVRCTLTFFWEVPYKVQCHKSISLNRFVPSSHFLVPTLCVLHMWRCVWICLCTVCGTCRNVQCTVSSVNQFKPCRRFSLGWYCQDQGRQGGLCRHVSEPSWSEGPGLCTWCSSGDQEDCRCVEKREQHLAKWDQVSEEDGRSNAAVKAWVAVSGVVVIARAINAITKQCCWHVISERPPADCALL